MHPLDRLIRIADALITAILWLIAGVGVLLFSALGHALEILVALALARAAWWLWKNR